MESDAMAERFAQFEAVMKVAAERERIDEILRSAAEPSEEFLKENGIFEEIKELRRLLAEEEAAENAEKHPPKEWFDKFHADCKMLGEALWEKGGCDMLHYAIDTFVPRAQKTTMDRGFDGVGRGDDVWGA